MIGSSRKVKPQQQQRENELYFDFESGWYSSDSETISSFAYALRKVIKSDITRTLDKSEIEIIEKRFEDTSWVIFKELEQFNRALLQKSYKRPLRPDIIAIDGRILISPNSSTAGIERKDANRKERQPTSKIPVPTIENVWNEPEPASRALHLQPATAKQTSKSRLGKNAVSPAAQNHANNSNRKGDMCRIT